MVSEQDVPPFIGDESLSFEVAKLYVATFNRAPDQGGLLYWLNSSGLALEEIAQSFFDQPETQTLYPPNTSASTFVTSVYENLFNRLPDAEGLAYWVAQLESGTIAKHYFILAVINGAQNTASGQDAMILANKTSVALLFADEGFNNTQHAADIMNDIDATEQSVSDALSQIVAWKYPLYEEALNLSRVDTDVGVLSSFSTYGVAALNSGYQWEDDTVTYSFNMMIPSDYYAYGDPEIISGWESFSMIMRAAVSQMSTSINELLDIRLQYVSTLGDIRFNVIETQWGGFAYYPMNEDPIDGDVFISNIVKQDPTYYSLVAGGTGWNLIAHELGHALGLKHPFEDGNELPSSLDDSAHTVMSYTDYNRYSVHSYIDTNGYIQLEYLYINPTLYSLYDVSALQAIYGANLTTRTGNDTYSVSLDAPAYITIWDAGGEDTIDCSDATGECTISLVDGTINSADVHSLSQQIVSMKAWAHSHGDSYSDTYISEAYMNIADSFYTGENNLGIAVGVIIENLTTGSGNDRVWDNSVNNTISTGAGDDKIYLGAGGWDSVDGGEGFDTIYLDVLQTQISTAQNDSGEYRLVGNDFAVNLIGVEQVSFSNGTTSLVSSWA